VVKLNRRDASDVVHVMTATLAASGFEAAFPTSLSDRADRTSRLTRDEAFRACYEQEFGHLAGYCYQLVRDTELARDLAQEAFIRLFSRWLSVREPRPWLFHVATNLARDHWRRAARDRVLTEALAAPAEEAAPPDVAVRDAVDRLPTKYRDVVCLYYYADLSLSDVAQAVRRPEGTVKRMLSEARGLLATSLGDQHG
jgi:RNA polymerase sigma-70 factor (ECF subfamily)